ncbi:hypothetical protein SUGI_0827950 [Cryptomeria japonica]|nr:hypothetical protein SUGI_0827950 [Cryptomeria japonica]
MSPHFSFISSLAWPELGWGGNNGSTLTTGVSAIVHRALCTPFNEIVAIKVLDLEKCNSNLGCESEADMPALRSGDGQEYESGASS